MVAGSTPAWGAFKENNMNINISLKSQLMDLLASVSLSNRMISPAKISNYAYLDHSLETPPPLREDYDAKPCILVLGGSKLGTLYCDALVVIGEPTESWWAKSVTPYDSTIKHADTLVAFLYNPHTNAMVYDCVALIGRALVDDSIMMCVFNDDAAPASDADIEFTCNLLLSSIVTHLRCHTGTDLNWI